MNTDLRRKAKNDFEKYFIKLMNNVVFGKSMENVRKRRDIKLVTTERRNYLVSEPQRTIFILQSNLHKTTTLGTTQKRLSWTGGCLIRHLYKITTNQIWLF